MSASKYVSKHALAVAEMRQKVQASMAARSKSTPPRVKRTEEHNRLRQVVNANMEVQSKLFCR